MHHELEKALAAGVAVGGAEAWPPEIRDQLGPTVLLWVVLGLIVLAPIPVLWVAVRAILGRGSGPDVTRPGRRHVAGARSVRRLP
ncbi:MAG: hypothetical protein WKF86_04835 [Acidimicrobiales bacterium]